jgi:class 3 adenylate cyclase/predicted ATPase
VTFEEILDQALAMLQRRGRVTYRTLQRQFNLDDAALEDLKEALLYAHPHVADDPGHGLLWRGETTSTPPPIPSAPQPAPRLAAQDLHSTQAAPLPTDARPPEAERRQLTVLFCDLVESTALAADLDPEELLDVVRAYQTTCAEVIQRLDGHIAQYLGDGVLVYFGYPQAHEDDAPRAVRAGLAIVEAIGTLETRLIQERGVRLVVRIGIHTGPVVVGEMGNGGRHEQLALGETPNLAARLQSLARPNQVVISAQTRRLVGRAFELEELGVHALKGVPTPQQVYSVRGERVVESRFEATSSADLTLLVGREEELSLVLRRWAQAREGEGQVVLLAGEAGIGKSRLLQTVRERLATEPHIQLQYQCSPYHTNSAFYPIIVQLQRAARFEPGDSPAQKHEKLETLLAQATARVADVAPLFAALLSIPTGDRYPPLSLSPQHQKAQTIAALVDQWAGLSCRQPVLSLVEDAHWCDPTTLEVLDQIVSRVPELRVLVIMTSRPEFEAPWTASHITTLTLTRLSRAQVTAMVTQLTEGRALPTEVLAQILAKTDGVPLFVEELTKAILESGLLHEVGEHYALTGPLPPLAIPATVQDSLMARLDRLAPVKEVAQFGAALGREFTYNLLAAVAPLRDQALEEALEQLVKAGLLFRQGQPPEARYRFKHALVQDAAYASLLRSRRQALHTRVATALEARFPALVEAEPEVLAQHYTAADLRMQAIPYWLRAGHRAVARSAYVEAIGHLSQGLELLKTLPETPERSRQELDMQTSLGLAFMATKGFAAPEVERAYARARELCQQVGATAQLPPVLRGLWLFYNVRGEFQLARDLGEQLLTLAQRMQDQALLVEAHRAVGETLFRLGELVPARAHLEEGMACYDPQQHRSHIVLYGHDPGVLCLSYAARALWLLGYPHQALKRSHEVLALAQQLSHPHSLVFALYCLGRVHQFRREGQAARERAEALIAFAREQALPHWVASGTILYGWALAEQGQVEEGIAQMRQGLSDRRATGAELGRPYYLAQLAEASGKGGWAEEGLRVLAEVLAVVNQQGERWGEAELYRLKGELLLRRAAGGSGSPTDPATTSIWAGAELSVLAEAETCFQQALALARRQEAKSLELRVAMRLSRLWQNQGQHAEAWQLLAVIYGWFTEGFDTADLQEAKALLEELSR